MKQKVHSVGNMQQSFGMLKKKGVKVLVDYTCSVHLFSLCFIPLQQL
jgi:hypothetical protein